MASRDSERNLRRSVTRLKSSRIYDASGLVLAPGFVDTHSHHDGGLLIELTALAAVS